MSKFLKTSLLVEGVHTDIVVQPFADRILVLVTQLGKVGNLIQVSVPSTTVIHHDTSSESSNHPGGLPRPSIAIQLTPILGSAPTEHMHALHSLYAAQIATLIWHSPGVQHRHVIVGIALRRSTCPAGSGEVTEEERNAFHSIMDVLREMLM